MVGAVNKSTVCAISPFKKETSKLNYYMCYLKPNPCNVNYDNETMITH